MILPTLPNKHIHVQIGEDLYKLIEDVMKVRKFPSVPYTTKILLSEHFELRSKLK